MLHIPMFRDDNLILLVDPLESASDLDPFCPTLMSLSSRLTTNDLKNWNKARNESKAIVDPWTRPEIEAMTCCVEALDTTPQAAEVLRRFEQVGGIPRIIFFDSQYNERKRALESTKFNDFFNDFPRTTLDPTNVPSVLELFLAPCTDEKFVVPQDDDGTYAAMMSAKHAVLRPLSRCTASRLRELAVQDTSKRLKRKLEKIGVPYVVEEMYVAECILENSIGESKCETQKRKAKEVFKPKSKRYQRN